MISQNVERDFRLAKVRRSQQLNVEPAINLSLKELTKTKKSQTKTKYVMVEESYLEELSKFEEKVRKDASELERHAMIPDTSSLAIPHVARVHIPIPSARMAVHSVCESEMRKIAADIALLNSAWIKHMKDNHYNKQHLFIRENYLNRGPLQQKALKLRLVNEAAQNWILRKERDTMSFEDDMSRLVGKYVDAQIRRRDYDRYYVLASRYGVWSELKYYRDTRPGKRYWQQVTNGALKLQKLWCHYWAITRLRRYRSARLIQTYWRCSYHFRKNNPLIKLRVKYGKRSVMKYFWIKWNDYKSLVKRIRDALKYHMQSWRDKCFVAWRDRYKSKKNRKEEILTKFILRMKNMEIAGKFLIWHNYVLRRKRGKLFLRRLLQCPHFDVWHQFTLNSLKKKKIAKDAAVIQSGIRMYLRRKRYLKMKSSKKVLNNFALIVISKGIARTKRDATIMEEFVEWKPEEIYRRDRAAAEIEKRRMTRRMQQVADKELKAGQDMKRHWRTRHGKLQIQELCTEIALGSYATDIKFDKKKGRSEAQQEQAKRDLLRRCKYLARRQEVHEFQVKLPPYLECPDPCCREVFTSARLYRAHVLTSDLHRLKVVNEDGTVNYTDVAPLPDELVVIQKNEDDDDYISSSPVADNNNRILGPTLNPVSNSAKQLEIDTSVGSSGKALESAPQLSARSFSIRSTGMGGGLSEPFVISGPIAVKAATECSRDDILDPYTMMKSTYPFCDLHLQLKNQRGVDLLRNYLIRIQGIDAAVNCVDLWCLLQEWKKNSVYSEQFKSRALNVLETYLCGDCSRPLQLLTENLGYYSVNPIQIESFLMVGKKQSKSSKNGGGGGSSKSGKSVSSPVAAASPRAQRVNIVELGYIYDNINLSMDKITKRLTCIKDGGNDITSNQFEPGARATASFWRRILGLGGAPYLKWTDEYTISPDMFDMLEWHALMKLYHTLINDEMYFTSPEYVEYLAIVMNDDKAREEALIEDYKQYRLSEILRWATSFKQQELAMSAFAFEIVDMVFDKESDMLFISQGLIGASEVVDVVRHDEQKKHEALQLTVDEALDWVFFDTMDAIYEFFVPSMINCMLQLPELRKGLLQYSGLLKDKKSSKLLKQQPALNSLDAKKAKEKEDAWFQPFFTAALDEESKSMPLEASVAVTRIQKIVRGAQGRKLAKREFAGTFFKKYVFLCLFIYSNNMFILYSS